MNDPEYFEALRRLNTLQTQGIDPAAPESDEIQSLQLAIDLYEQQISQEPLDNDQQVC